MSEELKPCQRWVIIGGCGLYTGQWLTRRDAIKAHCEDLGKTWDYCKAKGDAAIKVLISPLTRTDPKPVDVEQSESANDFTQEQEHKADFEQQPHEIASPKDDIESWNGYGEQPQTVCVDELAQEIRRVDGNHDLGAGSLAEALMPFLISQGYLQSGVPEGFVVVPIEPTEAVIGSDLTFFQKQRHKWIAERVYPFNRSDLCNAFDISIPCASYDIKAFIKNNPLWLSYNTRKKQYEPRHHKAAQEG